jgi:hypothetical protein
MVTGGWQLSRMGLNEGYAPVQPIAFSHRVHAGENRIACLYCHSAARTSRHAGIPAASVCMGCHAILERRTAEIEKLKEAVQLRRPIAWTQIHVLPAHVHFDHSRHVRSGVACQRCHGPVETMDRLRQVSPLTMGWCLECHRAHAGIPASGLSRAGQHVARGTPISAGLDCASCHH